MATDKLPESEPRNRSEEDLENLVAGYVDRLTEGEKIDPYQILAEHPSRGLQIVEHLEAFIDPPSKAGFNEPLGSLGDYTLRRRIGCGGMGVVYDAWDNSMDRRVALKVLPAAVAADNKAFLRFMREAKTAGRLSHPHVVPVFAMGVKEQTPYYAMEFVEGKTLAQVLVGLKKVEPESDTIFGKKDSLIYFGKIAETFAAVADGLQHAHSKGIIHRDIKPSNLILDRDGRLRILDFGLARLEGQESITQSGDFLGTPLYMSPEQARRKKITVDHRTDIYSLGATIYELITGRPPFEGKDHGDILSQIIERDPAEPRKANQRVPRDLETIILKCLRKDPVDRYGTAEALGQDLERFLRGDPIEARSPSRWEAISRRLWRRRVLLGFASLGLALLATLVLIIFQYFRATHAAREAEYVDLLGGAAEELHLGHFAGRVAEAHMQVLLRELDSMLEGRPEQRLEGQLARLDRARGLVPGRPDAAFYRARVLLALKRVDQATGDLEALLREHPRFTPAISLAASIEERRSGQDRARVKIEKLRGNDPDGRAYRWFEAQSAAARCDWPAAAAAWTEYLRLGEGLPETYHGADLDALVGRGTARMNSGDLFGACVDFAKANGRWPEALGPVLLEARALSLHKSDRAKEAADSWLHAAFERTPRRDEFVLRAAGLCLEAGFEDGPRAHNWIGRSADERLRGWGHLAHAWIGRIADERLRERAKLAAHLCLGESRQAVDLGEKLLAGSPDDVFVAAHLALACMGVPGEYEKGLQLAEVLSRRNDLTPLVLIQLAGVFGTMRADFAIELLERARKVDPGCVEARVNLAWNLFWGRRLREAEQVLASFTDWERDEDPTILFMNGVVRRYQGDTEGGRRFLERSTRLSGSRPNSAWLYLALIPWKAGKFEEAEAILREDIRLNPTDPIQRGIFAQFLDQRGEYDEALEEYCQALPDMVVLDWWQVQDIERSFSRILRWKPRPRFLGALDSCIEAYSRLPEERFSPLVCENLALASLLAPQRRDPARARSLAERAVAASERKNPEILATLAMVRFEGGEREEAVRILEEAAAMPGVKAQGLEQLADYRRTLLPRLASLASCDAALLDVGNEVDRVRNLLEDQRATTGNLSPDTGLIAYLEGCAHELEGDGEKAISSWQSAAGRFPGRSEPVLRLAESLQKIHRAAEAEQILREAISAGGEPAWDLWVAWWRLGVGALGLTPAQMIERFPVAPGTATSPRIADDFRWLLESLRDGAPLAIDSGSEADFVEDDGKRWSRDRFFLDGWTSPMGQAAERIDPRPRGPHRTARFFDEDQAFAGYRVPLACGRYQVTLLFAEYWNDQCYLNAWIEGDQKLEDYHALTEAGWATLDRRVFEVDLTDEVLDIQLRGAEGHRKFPVHLGGIEIERVKS